MQEIKSTQLISYCDAKTFYEAMELPSFVTSFTAVVQRLVSKVDASTQTKVASVFTNT